MSEDFEDRLREALRPIEPDEEFARRVMSRVQSEPRRSMRVQPLRWLRVQPLRSLRAQPLRRRWVSAALAASVVLAVLAAHEWHVRRERAGLEARRQLMEALQLTREKLDLAYQVINRQSQAESGGNPGA